MERSPLGIVGCAMTLNGIETFASAARWFGVHGELMDCCLPHGQGVYEPSAELGVGVGENPGYPDVVL